MTLPFVFCAGSGAPGIKEHKHDLSERGLGRFLVVSMNRSDIESQGCESCGASSGEQETDRVPCQRAKGNRIGVKEV